MKQWEAKPAGAKRSVFGNYSTADPADGSSGASTLEAEPPRVDPPGQLRLALGAPNPAERPIGLVDIALARAFIHRFLAQAFEDPTSEAWLWLASTEARESLGAAVKALNQPALEAAALPLEQVVAPGTFDSFRDDYVSAFGHAARGSCPLNEIEYGSLKADPLFQPHRLADLAAFYRAFGLEIADDSAERQDHLSIELEFMSVLAAKEAYALHGALPAETLALCRDAQTQFLREHLGRWSAAFARRLASHVSGPLAALAQLLRTFVESECARFGVTPGGDDLLLRPVDDALERMCESCGVRNLPPGALATGATT